MSMNWKSASQLAIVSLMLNVPLLSGAEAVNPVQTAKVTGTKLQHFPLHQVRLAEGSPFKNAQDLLHAYLVNRDTDRLLSDFRRIAGLPFAVKPYEIGGFRGHFTGHYLSACAQMYAATGDDRLRQQGARVVQGLAECQAKYGTGYISAFPETNIDVVILGKAPATPEGGVPWYALHKSYAGLLDQYLLCTNRQALEVLETAMKWVHARVDPLSDVEIATMLRIEHGGMNEFLANLYAVTGRRDYLQLARRFNHLAVLEPLMRSEDRLDNLHANTTIPKVTGLARQYELTGDPAMRKGAEFFWRTVTKERSYVTGSNCDHEAFSPKARLSQYLDWITGETCNVYNMLKLTEHLMMWDPSVEYADYYERALINHILSSQNPKDGRMLCALPLGSGSVRSMHWDNPEYQFPCCTGTGIENHAKYGQFIYSRNGATNLYVNLFIGSELRWPEHGLVLTQESRFPEEERSLLSFACNIPLDLNVYIRQPSWATGGFQVLVNGRATKAQGPSTWVVLSRTWNSGDKVEVRTPMTLHSEGFNDDPNRRAILYGPIVLCGITQTGNVVSVIREDMKTALSALKHVEAAVAFAGTAVDGEAGGMHVVASPFARFTAPAAIFRTSFDRDPSARELTFQPLYQTYDEPAAVYWDVSDASKWDALVNQYAPTLAAEESFRSRVLDSSIWLTPGDRNPHAWKGQHLTWSNFGYRNYIRSFNNGWFSCQLKVAPDAPVELLCLYNRGDTFQGDFDILIDDVKIAAQQLTGKGPNEFFYVQYPIPADLTANKDKVTVRFQSQADKKAGPLYRCATLRAAL